MPSTLPRLSAEVPAFCLPVFAGLNPWVAADLSDFLALDPTIPESFRAQYREAKAYFGDPTAWARKCLTARLQKDAALITDNEISTFILNTAPPEPPRAIIIGRVLNFNGGTTGTGKSVAASSSVTQAFTPQGGRNAVVLGVRATAFVTSGVNSVNLDLVNYEDIDSNKYTWQESTPCNNVCGTGPEPGLIYPQRWYGQLQHNIKITNNFTSTADVLLNYICAVLYMPGGA